MKPKLTHGDWAYRYTSAKQARLTARREHEYYGVGLTDGGGADGYVYAIREKAGRYNQTKILAFAPHNREIEQDHEVEANLHLMSKAKVHLQLLRDAESAFREVFTVQIDDVLTEDEDVIARIPELVRIARFLRSKNYSHIRFSSEGYRFQDLSAYHGDEVVRFSPPPPGVPIGDPSEAQAI